MRLSSIPNICAGWVLLISVVVQGEVYLTRSDLASRWERLPDPAWVKGGGTNAIVVRIDPARRLQTILGLGSSLESSTCENLAVMSEGAREEALGYLLSPVHGLGMNLMRVCIGTSDFTGTPWYSYDDLAPGGVDPLLEQFSIEKDRAVILPVLKRAKVVNPELLFFASPWSPPGWMKTTGNMIGGSLKREYYGVYANYFVRFIRAYAAEGIPIHAVTVQNEPGVDRSKEKDARWFYPSCRWTGEEERVFIRDHLGPALAKAGLRTRIWCYDHNYNEKPGAGGEDPGIDYPRTILSDPEAAREVEGVAFHGYQGEPSAMGTLIKEFPGKTMHFTEGSVFGIGGARDLAERLRNGASSYNAWVSMLDTEGKPNRGPFEASRTVINLNRKTGRAERGFDYYLYGHFMRFIKRGAVGLGVEGGVKPISTVAFENPDRSRILVLVNVAKVATRVGWSVVGDARQFEMELPAESLLTWVSSGVGR